LGSAAAAVFTDHMPFLSANQQHQCTGW